MQESAAAKGKGQPLIIGRYAVFDVLASGGMATVHLGRLLGPGVGRTVALKKLHPQFGKDEEFVKMFRDEARVVSHIRHPNVVPLFDVIDARSGLILVMEYIHGESFATLLRACRSAGALMPIDLASTVIHDTLLGIHGAHETRGPGGEILEVVHRDVSPQNLIIGLDGISRVLDFGVAKSAGRMQVTREGQLKGKLAYMAPEQIRGSVDRRADVFAASVVFWEALTGRRLHEGFSEVDIVARVVKGDFQPPSAFRPEIPRELDAVVLRGLDVDLHRRYPTALAMATDLEHRIELAPPSAVGHWVETLAAAALRTRAQQVVAMERAAGALVAAEAMPVEFMPVESVPVESVPAAWAPPLVTPRPQAFVAPPSTPRSAYTAPGRPAPPPVSSPSVGSATAWLPPFVDRTTLAAIGIVCGALVIAGFALGGFALRARSLEPDAEAAPSARPAAPPPSSSVPPRRGAAR